MTRLVLILFGDDFNFASKSQLYIVYMGEKKHDDPSVVTASHHDILTSVLGRYYWLVGAVLVPVT